MMPKKRTENEKERTAKRKLDSLTEYTVLLPIYKGLVTLGLVLLAISGQLLHKASNQCGPAGLVTGP